MRSEDIPRYELVNGVWRPCWELLKGVWVPRDVWMEQARPVMFRREYSYIVAVRQHAAGTVDRADLESEEWRRLVGDSYMTDHTIIFADALDGLRSLEAESIDCCFTSPPYWGLRSYGTHIQYRAWVPSCALSWVPQDHPDREEFWHETPIGFIPQAAFPEPQGRRKREHLKHRWLLLQMRAERRGGLECPVTGTRIDALGWEPTPSLYVDHLVAIFAEVRRVLKPGGTVALNLGDSYASNPSTSGFGLHEGRGAPHFDSTKAPGLKPKDLVMIPARAALALQADGWWLRNDCIWHKPNPMPESVTDRYSTTYEHVFLLAKQARYWFDLDAVREPLKHPNRTYGDGSDHKTAALKEQGNRSTAALHDDRETYANPLGRNPGDVVKRATQPTPYAHFATFPLALVEHFLPAIYPPKVCAECGEPHEHVIETEEGDPAEDYTGQALHDYATGGAQDPSESKRRILAAMARKKTGDRYEAACACNAPAIPGIVLDPFAGSGTTTQVARKLGRRSIGIELNPEYEAVMRERLDLPAEGSLFGDEDLGVEFRRRNE